VHIQAGIGNWTWQPFRQV